jgi:hypothetical protein
MEHSKDDIQRLPRDPLRFELLQLFSGHVSNKGGNLQDLAAQAQFVPVWASP